MLVNFFGKTPMTEIMDLFLSHPYSDYSVDDLIDIYVHEFPEENISEEDIETTIDEMESFDMLVQIDGRYKLAKGAFVVQAINSFDNELAKMVAECEAMIFKSDTKTSSNLR